MVSLDFIPIEVDDMQIVIFFSLALESISYCNYILCLIKKCLCFLFKQTSTLNCAYNGHVDMLWVIDDDDDYYYCY